MRGITKLSSLAVLAFMTTLVFSMPMSAGDTDKDWTVLLYNDGDNNLESYALTSLSQLEMIGSDDNVNLVALTDTLLGRGVPPVCREGQPGEHPRLRISEGSGHVQRGDARGVHRDRRLGVTRLTHYAVILWDHGGGWRGICWDDTTLRADGRGRLHLDGRAEVRLLGREQRDRRVHRRRRVRRVPDGHAGGRLPDEGARGLPRVQRGDHIRIQLPVRHDRSRP